MPTLFSHPVPALALAVGMGARSIPPRLVLAAVVCSVLPDLDTISYLLRLPGGLAAHRGFSHSLLIAALMGCFGALFASRLHCGRGKAFLILFAAAASHGLLDAMTSGGSGVAFFWPWDDTRFFLPWRPIQVSPIRPEHFFTERGWRVLVSEIHWIWLPCLVFAVAGQVLRRLHAARQTRRTA